MESDIAIIDLDSIMFTIAHPNKVLDEDRVPVKKDGKFVYINDIAAKMMGFESAEELMNLPKENLEKIYNSDNLTQIKQEEGLQKF